MSNFREMAPERLFEKISDFKKMNMLYIILNLARGLEISHI